MLSLSLAILCLIAGLFLIIIHPLSRTQKISPYWEIGAGALAVIGFLFFLTIQYIMPGVIEDELAKAPCGFESPQGACYSLTRPLCESAWQNAEASCKAELSVVHRERPTALIGPALNRCKARKMDQTLHFNRKNADTAYCRAYFNYIGTSN